MKHTTEMDPELLVQPAAPGMTVPKEFGEKVLFLLNFAPVLCDDVWDDYGNKNRPGTTLARSCISGHC
jgi:hypothetical protein